MPTIPPAEQSREVRLAARIAALDASDARYALRWLNTGGPADQDQIEAALDAVIRRAVRLSKPAVKNVAPGVTDLTAEVDTRASNAPAAGAFR